MRISQETVVADGKPKRERSEVTRLVVALVLTAILVAFVVANYHPVKVSFLATDRHPRLIWVLLVTAIIGAVLDRLWLRRHKD